MATINTVYNKESEIKKDLEEIMKQVNEYNVTAKALLSVVKDEQPSEIIQVAMDCMTRHADKQIDRVKSAFTESNKEALYFAACVDNVLGVLVKHGLEPGTHVNYTEVINKTLECASYQKWQEIKKEAWGRNEGKGRF